MQFWHIIMIEWPTLRHQLIILGTTLAISYEDNNVQKAWKRRDHYLMSQSFSGCKARMSGFCTLVFHFFSEIDLQCKIFLHEIYLRKLFAQKIMARAFPHFIIAMYSEIR